MARKAVKAVKSVAKSVKPSGRGQTTTVKRNLAQKTVAGGGTVVPAKPPRM